MHVIAAAFNGFCAGRSDRATAYPSSAKAAGGERGDVDRRRTASDEIGDELAGHRCGGHADMAVAEGVDHVRGGPRWTENRQRVGQAGPMAHPQRYPLLR